MKQKIEYGKWIGQMKWDLFVTLHYYNGGTQKNSRSNITYLNNRNSKYIKRLFFISERGNDGSTHAHLLINTGNRKKTIRSLEPLKKWCDVHCEVINPLLQENKVLFVGKYLTKSITEDIDYDILINHIDD